MRLVSVSSPGLRRIVEETLEGEDDVLILNAIDPKAFWRKCRLIRHIAADMDGTLTSGNIWEEVAYNLSPQARAADADDRARYFTQAMRTPAESAAIEAEWGARSVARIWKCDLTRDHVRNAGVRVPPRDSFKELVGLFERKIIVSFGIGDAIQYFLDHHGVTAEVAAYRFLYDNDGRVTGYHSRSAVTSATKGLAIEAWREKHRIANEGILTIFDGPVDVHMVHRERLNILIIPRHEPNAARQRFRLERIPHLHAAGLTAILVADNFTSLTGYLQFAQRGGWHNAAHL